MTRPRARLRMIDPLWVELDVGGLTILMAPCPDGTDDHSHFFCGRCRWELRAPGHVHPPQGFGELAEALAAHRCGTAAVKGGSLN